MTWEEISGAFTREFVPRLQARPPVRSTLLSRLRCAVLRWLADAADALVADAAAEARALPLPLSPRFSPPPPFDLLQHFQLLQAAVKAAIKRATSLGVKIAPVAAAKVGGEEGAGGGLASEEAAPKR